MLNWDHEETPSPPDLLAEFTRETIDRLLKELPVEKRLAGVPVEKRLEGVPVEKRLEGVSAEEIVAVLSPQARATLARLLKTNGAEPKSE